MGTIVLRPNAIVSDHTISVGARVTVRDGSIEAIDRDAAGETEVTLDGILLPGAIDLQVNGAAGRCVAEATPDALDMIARACAAGGAAAFLPTLITAEIDRLCQQVAAIADWIDTRTDEAAGAIPLGIHLEGPFLEVAGAHPQTSLIDPGPTQIDALLAAGRGHVKLVTLAPGRRGAAAAVARLVDRGVAVALGHAADASAFTACVDAGARAVTHLFNAMSPLHHREANMVGAALDDERVSCSLILDGTHVTPAAARIAFRCLGPDRTILITDSTAAAGMPDGSFKLGGQPVAAVDGVVRDAAGRLAGSALTMSRAAREFRSMIPAVGAWSLARVLAKNPARVLAQPRWGTIEPGAIARFSLLTPSGELLAITP